MSGSDCGRHADVSPHALLDHIEGICAGANPETLSELSTASLMAARMKLKATIDIIDEVVAELKMRRAMQPQIAQSPIV